MLLVFRITSTGTGAVISWATLDNLVPITFSHGFLPFLCESNQSHDGDDDEGKVGCNV